MALERTFSDDEEESTLGWALLPQVMEDAGTEDGSLRRSSRNMWLPKRLTR